MEGVYTAEVIIDNGAFGVHKIRFETGRLAKLAGGSAVVYLDDETMVLSTTTAGKSPREGFDFFPLTVDVEERMYAAGRIPGSFFRREGRPSEDAILTCRLIDRPLRPSFVKGLRNEVQVVETIMALHPDHLYDVVAINAASMSTQLAGLPFSGPIGGVRVALIKGQWVGFPTHPQLADATFDMVVAGRLLEDGDVAIMMVEAESTPSTLRLIADCGQRRRGADRGDGGRGPGGGQAVHQGALRGPAGDRQAARPRRPPSSRSSPTTARTCSTALEAEVGADLAQALTIAGKQRARYRDRPDQGAGDREAGRPVRGPGEGDQRGVPRAEQEAGPAADHPRRAAHRRPRAGRHPAAVRRGGRRAAGARLGAVRARRDPGPRRHHAEHAPDGADDRHAEP